MSKSFLFTKRVLASKTIYAFIHITFLVGLFVILKYTHSSKAGNLILWATAYVIALYTQETSELKRITRAQLHHEQAPIIVVKNGFMQKDMLSIGLHNSGRGVAKDIEIFIHNIKVFHGATLLPIDSMYNHTDTRSASQNADKLTNLLNERKSTLTLRVEYKDVNGRKFATKDLIWNLDTNDVPNADPRYSLDISKWDYKNLT
jgi:hypothetical protein